MGKKKINSIIDEPFNSTKQLFEVRETDSGSTLILNRNHPFFLKDCIIASAESPMR